MESTHVQLWGQFESPCCGGDDDEEPRLLNLRHRPTPSGSDDIDQQVDGVVDRQAAEVDRRRVLADDARTQPDQR